jgi:uncharacterized protein
MGSRVYFIPLPDAAPLGLQKKALRKLFDGSGASSIVREHDFAAIKVHVGEKSNRTHMNPQLVKVIVERVRDRGCLPFLTETSTLYKSERSNAVKHLEHAARHGFGLEKMGAPFIMADGLLGNHEMEVPINGELHRKVRIAGDIVHVDALYAVAHVTGHIASGMGAAIKTLGMGLASRKGKLRQHAALKPEINAESCRFCGKCMQWCPQNAIAHHEGKARIMAEKCIGCGECLAMCRYDAVKFDWGAESALMQKSMAEHALGVIAHKKDKCFFFNFLLDMTKDCDCFGVDQQKVARDLGMLASCDPVAIDKASLDLTAEAFGKTIAEISYGNQDALVQISHGEKIGLGSTDYDLVKI